MAVQSADAPVAERGPVVDFTYFFCAAWGPPLGHPGPLPPIPVPRRRNPPWDAPVDKGPCRQRGQSGSISTSPGIRGGNTDMGLSIATPPGRRRESGCDFERANRFDPTEFSYDAEFWLREARQLVAPAAQCTHTRTCRTCTCTCGWGVVEVAVVAGGEPQEEGERCVRCFRIEPAARRPLAGDMSAVCPRFQDLGLLGAAGGCWGARGFHSMVLEENKAHRGERGGNSRAAGRRRIWGNCPWRVCVRVVRERGCVCVCLCYCMTSLCTTLLLVEVPTASQYLPTTCYLPQIFSKQKGGPA